MSERVLPSIGVVERIGVRDVGFLDRPHSDAGQHSDRAAVDAPTRLVRIVDWYQRATEGRLSPCRFTPSCSSYAKEALAVHGAWRGLWLTVRRLLRCRPFGPSGFDPVPEPPSPGAAAHSPVPLTHHDAPRRARPTKDR